MIGLNIAAPAATDRVELPDSPTTTTALWNEFTIAAWMYLRADTDPNFIFAKLNSGGVQTNYFRLINGFNLFINRTTGNCEVQTDTAQYALNTPIFVAITFNTAGVSAATTVNIYVGYIDTPVTEVAYSFRDGGAGAATAVTGNLIIGNRSAPYTKSLNGLIYDFHILNRYLSIEEVEDLRLAPEDQLITPNSVLYYAMGRDGLTTQYDITGNGNNGTITGTTLGDSLVSRPMGEIEPYYVFGASSPAPQVLFRRAGRFV